jgi:hypothetical protein
MFPAKIMCHPRIYQGHFSYQCSAMNFMVWSVGKDSRTVVPHQICLQSYYL